MKKNLLLVLTLAFLVSTSFASSFVAAEMNNTQNSRDSRFEMVSWIDDFEGEDNWTTVDETSAPQGWHVHNEGGTHGNVWWMGGENGGYINELYLVLDTPAIPVSAGNSTLTFDMNYKVEEPGGTGEYNGWDAMNIRVSTDQENWTVVDGTPAYSATSCYSFGAIHGEGPGIPGWGGSSNGWINASFDLSEYEGQSIYVRFAFASDPAYNTDDDPTLFGMKVDNIALGSFTNDGSEGDMVASSMVPLGGDIWNLVQVPNAFSGSHVYRLQNDEGTYNPNLFNSLISPVITLPSEGEITATFELMGEFEDLQSGGNDLSKVDYVGYEIKVEGTNQWFAMSNPYGSPDGLNYVYSSVSDIWWPFHEAYNGLDGRIDDYAGEDVRFKIYFKSDDDDPIGWGLMVDDFRILTEVFLAEVNNLQAEVNNNEVDLTWEQPLQMVPQEVAWATSGWTSYVNDGQPYAIKVQNTDNYAKPLSTIGFMLYNNAPSGVTGSATVYAWADAGGLPGAQIAAVSGITGMMSQAWMNVDVMSENIIVPANSTIYVGIGGFDAGDQGLLAEGTTSVVGSYGSFQGTWAPLDEAYTGLKNVAIRAEILEDDPTLPSADSYKVYHSENGSNYNFLGETVNTEYHHSSPVLGALNYYKVTALFGVNESQGVTTTAFLLPAGLTEIINDDGSSEQAFEAGVSNILGTKFVHTHEATLKYIKFYVETLNPGNMLYRIYSAANGMPVENLVTAVINNGDLVQGWNTIELQAPHFFENGQFFISFVNVNNSPLIGLDTNSSGNLYLSTDQGQNWELQTQGNLLVRALVENGEVDNYDQEIAPFVSNITNYPNPFNPETNISFNMSKAGRANVAIYNLRGQLVNTILDGEVAAGVQNVVWNGTDSNNKSVASGVYFFRVKTDNQTVNKKMVLQK